MSAQVLLLRGVNVGGHGRLPMAELRAMLDAMGAGGARTHLQSGNAVCPQAIDPQALSARIAFQPMVLALTATEWRVRVATNPFPTDAPKALHGFFFDGPRPDTSAMTPVLAPSERISSHPGVLWLHAPDGIGRSKFAARAERLAACPVTARNWNTVAALSALLDAVDPR